MACAEALLLLSRQLDGVLGPADSRALDDHLAGCAACRVAARSFGAEHAVLRELWPGVTAPTGFAQRVAARLPRRAASRKAHLTRLPRRRWVAAAAALLLVLLGGSTLVQPEAWASLGLFLRRIVLHETASTTPSREIPVRRLTLDQAQALVPWPILQPSDLPAGYGLVAVEADEVHAFAAGPTIILHYQQSDGGADTELGVIELRAASEVSEPVAAGAARQVPVGDAGSGLFIDGKWVEQAGQQMWERGTLVRLIVERGDVVVQLQADPRAGWDADGLARAAASVR
jgi:anti-sigma factor RsiW